MESNVWSVESPRSAGNVYVLDMFAHAVSQGQQLDPQRSMLRVPCIGGNLVILVPSKCGYLHVQLSSSLEAS